MLIATLPPLDPHGPRIVSHPLVDGLRFNTAMRTLQPAAETIRRLRDLCGKKPLWVDLKARQLRITKWADPSYEFIELSHPIEVDLPTPIYFRLPTATSSRDYRATIVAVDGNRLILSDRPRYSLGAGQAVNIPDPSLRIHGFLTERDKEYIAASSEAGVHDYMLSFVEQEEDLGAVIALDPKARIWAKIESLWGLLFVRNHFAKFRPHVKLVAARDDLYVQIGSDKTAFFDAEERILRADPDAIAASRLLTSLEGEEEVSLGDLKDLRSLTRLGYKNFMFSDGLCTSAAAFERAVAVYGNFLSYQLRKEG